MAHRTTATGSSDPGASKPKGKVVQWAYFKNDGFQYTDVTGKVRRVGRDEWDRMKAQGLDKRVSNVKEIHKGGTWIRRGSPRWDALKNQGRTPVGQVRSRKMPPAHYGTPEYTKWVSGKTAPNQPYKPGTGPQNPGGGEDVGGAGGIGTNRRNSSGGTTPRPPKNPKGGGKTLKQLMAMMGNGNVGTMLPRKYADALAGMQYDAQIHDLNAQLGRQPVQAAQDQSDISNWYQQVQDLSHQAANRDAASGQQQSDSIGQLGQALMAAGGGSANGANGMLAGATQDSSALVNALGAIHSQYQNDMAPLLANEAAGAHRDEANKQTQAHQDLALQIADLMGQRGQAKTKAIMDIVQANNALAQTRFGNSLSKMQAAAGIQSIEPDLRLKQLQIQDQRIKNAGDATTVQTQQQQAHNGGKLVLSGLNPYQQSQIVSTWMTAADGSQRSKQAAAKVMKASGYGTHYAQTLLNSYYG